MTYPPRLCFDGALYHITARGDNRERIFIDDADRRYYLSLLHRYKHERFHFKLHAYVLMTNHIHLILEPSPGTIVSRIMQCLAIVYTRYFNRRHNRVGHEFQGRFRSRLIDKDTYLLVPSRYVHLNPVRAGLVRHPQEHPWSSYQAYLNGQDPWGIVDTADVLNLVLLSNSAGSEERRLSYRLFVEAQWPSRSDLELES